MRKHGGPLVPEALPRLEAALASEPRVVFGYVFGSQVTGETTPRSDVDVALWLREPLGEDDHLDMIGLVCGTLHRDDVDVVLLNKAGLALAFESLKGRLLLSKDETVRVHAESSIMSRYHDRRYYMDRHLRWAARDIIEKGWA